MNEYLFYKSYLTNNYHRLRGAVLIGVVSVAFNIDHPICAILSGIPIFPLSNTYGCKVPPDNLGLFALSCIGAVITCWIGLVVFVLYNSLRLSPTDTD